MFRHMMPARNSPPTTSRLPGDPETHDRLEGDPGVGSRGRVLRRAAAAARRIFAPPSGRGASPPGSWSLGRPGPLVAPLPWARPRGGGVDNAGEALEGAEGTSSGVRDRCPARRRRRAPTPNVRPPAAAVVCEKPSALTASAVARATSSRASASARPGGCAPPPRPCWRRPPRAPRGPGGLHLGAPLRGGRVHARRGAAAPRLEHQRLGLGVGRVLRRHRARRPRAASLALCASAPRAWCAGAPPPGRRPRAGAGA